MSPWVFYAVDVVQSLRIVMIITAGISIFGWFIAFPSITEDRFSSDDRRYFVLILFITSIIAVILAIFLPSSETMIQMIVAVTGTDIDNIRQIEEVTNAILRR